MPCGGRATLTLLALMMSVFAAAQLKSVLWSSYRAHARPPSCRVVHRYPLIVCHFGVEFKTAHKGLQLSTCKLIAIPFEASNGENPMWTRITSCTAPRPRPQSIPQRAVRCAARPVACRWRGGTTCPTSGCSWTTGWHGKRQAEVLS